MRRSLTFAMIAVALSAIPSLAEESGGGWKAAKKHGTKSTDASLAYRPSTQYEPPAKLPQVQRVGDVRQTQFVTSAENDAAEQASEVRRAASGQNARQRATSVPHDGGSVDVRGTIARARNAKGQSGYVLLDAAGDPRYILGPRNRKNLAPHVGKQVRVRGVAAAPDQAGRLPLLSIRAMAAMHGAGNAEGNIRPVTLLQVPQNAETLVGADDGSALAVAGQEEIPADAAQIASQPTEDVPPPRSVEQLQPPPQFEDSTPMLEEVYPGEGAEDGEVYYAPGEFGDGEIIVDGPVAGPRGTHLHPYPRGPLHRVLSRISGAWVRADYLLWSTEGMDLPPLVTTSPTGTPRSMAGVLGEDGTSVLFGDSTIFDDSRSGARIRAGMWWDRCHVWGIEGEYLALEDLSTNYRAASPGDPIVARPFFDPLAGQETSQLVAFPGVINGEIEVDAMTRFQSAGVRLRLNACNQTFACDACGVHGGAGGFWDQQWRSSGLPGAQFDCNQSSYRLDILGGYRFLLLDDQLRIREDLTSLDTSTPGTFDITDSFDAENRFHGGEIGLLFEMQRRRWSLELLTKIALGTTQEIVTINGTTISDEGGDVVTDPGGLLAQRTNIGTHKQNQFTAVPELGVTLGYQLTGHTRLTVGYSLIYWSRVARAGDQIDLDVNPNLLPPEVTPFAGPERPRFDFVESDFWAHGLTAGVDVRW